MALMHKQITKISGFILIAVIILLSKPLYDSLKTESVTLASIQTQPKNDSDLNKCEQDKDCTAVVQECCACDQGGAKVAINRKYYSYWNNKQNDQCLFVSCPNIQSDSLTCTKLTPKCVNQLCQMK